MHYFVITVQNQEASLPQRNYNSRLRYLICNWFQKEVAASMFKEPRNNYVIKLAYFLPRVVFLSPLLKCLFPGLDIIFIEENWTFPTTKYAARCNPKNGTVQYWNYRSCLHQVHVISCLHHTGCVRNNTCLCNWSKVAVRIFMTIHINLQI
jgi:hypothetical protein